MNLHCQSGYKERVLTWYNNLQKKFIIRNAIREVDKLIANKSLYHYGGTFYIMLWYGVYFWSYNLFYHAQNLYAKGCQTKILTMNLGTQCI